MPVPPVTKKKIPPTPKLWRNEVMGLWKFLHKVQTMEHLHGDKWVKSTYKYNKTRLMDLIDNQPEGARCPPRLRKWRDRLTP